MGQLSVGNTVAILWNADRIEVANGEKTQTVDGWILQPCVRTAFNKSHITPRLANKLAELQDLGLVELLITTGDVRIKLPLLSGKYQLRVDNGRLIRWPKIGMHGNL